MSQNRENDYPEMLRNLTAFIMINTEAKVDLKVVDKLFKLPEVVEIHCMHGNVDILAKISLTRDMLSSDAEVIGRFVQDKVRQTKGIISTQTLIPDASKIKA